MNRVLLTGRLTRDPEMRSLPSGKTVTNFSVATNEYRGGEERTEYHAIVTWERLAGLSVGFCCWMAPSAPRDGHDELDLHEFLRHCDAFDQLGEHLAPSLV